MIFLAVPFFLIELYLSLKTGETIGFFWSVVWIVLSFALGMMLLQKSSQTMMGNMQSMRQGKLDMRRFQNASMSYFVGAILLSRVSWAHWFVPPRVVTTLPSPAMRAM